MKYFLLLLFILISVVTTPAQTKYLIYFKDKGISPEQVLNKSSQAFQSALERLSDKSIARRRKVMGADIITYEDLDVNGNYVAQLESIGINIIHTLNWFNAVSAYLSDTELEQVKNFSFIQSVEKVNKLRYKNELQSSNFNKPLYKSSTTNYSLEYGFSFAQLELSDIPSVHDLDITGENVIIGILDSGFDWKNHPSLQNQNIIAEYDFIFQDSITSNEPEDHPGQESHGTYTLSVTGGFDEGNLIGASFNSKFILAKTEDLRSETHIEEDNYAAALEWMEGLGADITTSSLGYNEFNEPNFSYSYSDMDGKTAIVTRASELAFERGVVCITSAGNEGNTSWRYITAPADGFYTIAVGAVNNNNSIAGFSSRGPTSDGRIKPEIVTQGVNVLGATASSGDYNYRDGTSSAAPIAAGIAGLLLSKYPHLTNKQIRKIFLEVGDQSYDPDNDKGYGLLSALRAIIFPNINFLENLNEYIVNKIFFNNNGVDFHSVKIYYGKAGENLKEESLNYSGNLSFSFTLPYYNHGQEIEFYFIYNDSTGNSVREPSNENYKLLYGDMDISLNTIPFEYDISQNYPNPFNSLTTIKYDLPVSGVTNIKVYNILGQEIITLANQYQDAGAHSIIFKPNDIASGIYVYRIRVNDYIADKKMVYLK